MGRALVQNLYFGLWVDGLRALSKGAEAGPGCLLLDYGKGNGDN